jgi:uncharacterized HAD superfamily protein
MSILKIACDIDGVIADQFPAMRNIIKIICGKDIRKEDNLYYSFEQTFCLREGSDKLIVDEYNKNYLLDLEAINGSVEGIRYLYDNHCIVFCTSRYNRVDTEKWLIDKDFKYHNLFFIDGKDKVKFCIDNNFDLLIEDCGEICVEASE